MIGAEFLDGSRKMKKLYEAMAAQVCARWGLNQIETDILAFLHNHPGQDTAGDIVKLRMLQKGNVSKAVERLLKQGYLKRSQDEEDRRRIHLLLTSKAEEAVEQIEQVRSEYVKELFGDFSPQEKTAFYALYRRIFENAAAGLERRSGQKAGKE